MSQKAYSDTLIRSILTSVRTVAVVGASPNSARPSYGVLKFLLDCGYRVFAINPAIAEKDILGATVYARLADVPFPIDMVDVFRNSEAAGQVVDEALALDPLPKVIWMQLGVQNDAAAARAEAKGVTIIMNRCPKIEYPRLIG
ncbi:MAG TPA: CoA-binding protein [Beijerinckiaceae bacterium]|nr:CoA-binding protein [Beijerinckiaceae bacterium]